MLVAGGGGGRKRESYCLTGVGFQFCQILCKEF